MGIADRTTADTSSPTRTPGRLSAFSALELSLVSWWARHGITLLRLTLGVVFLWFGVLKFFPGASSAEDLATRTITVLTFGRMSPSASIS